MEVALNILTACLTISELKEQVSGELFFYLLSIMLSLWGILNLGLLIWSYDDAFMSTCQVLEAFASWLRLKHGYKFSLFWPVNIIFKKCLGIKYSFKLCNVNVWVNPFINATWVFVWTIKSSILARYCLTVRPFFFNICSWLSHKKLLKYWIVYEFYTCRIFVKWKWQKEWIAYLKMLGDGFSVWHF